MAQLSYAPLGANSVSVVGAEFCIPYPIDIVIARKPSSRYYLVVTDVNGNIMLKVKKLPSFLHDDRLIVDAADNPITTLRQTRWTMQLVREHYRWQVFRGDSKDHSDLLFSSKTPHIIQLKTKLNVYLANNTQENSRDFKLEAGWSDSNCTIYAGDSSTVIAQMHKKTALFGKDKFMVKVYPNVDYAFVAALIVILED